MSDVPEAVTEPQPLGSAFSYGAHLGPIKSLAVSGYVAVSGGTDDVIKIYDLKARSDMGALLQHEGGVTCLQVTDRTTFSMSDTSLHMYSASIQFDPIAR